MTVSDLRVLIKNLDEYIHIPGGIERLRNTVQHLAVSGQLVPQISSEGTGYDLLDEICEEKNKLIAEGRLKKQKKLSDISKEEELYEIPDNWAWVRLSEITHLITDGTHHTPQYKSNGVSFLSIKDISAGSLDFSDCKFISQEEHEEINKRCNPEIGDILFCRIGTLGRPVIVDTNKPFSIFVSLGLIKFNQELVMPEYLRLYLDSPATYKEYKRVMAGGSHTNKLNLNTMKELVTALPPVAEQKRIVERLNDTLKIIDKLDKKYKAEESERSKLVKSSLRALSHNGSRLALDNLAGIIKTKADAAELRKAVLHLAVSGKLVPQIESEGTGEDLYKQIEAIALNGKRKKVLPTVDENEIPFSIPYSWKWSRLGNIGATQTGATPPKTKSEYFGNFEPFIKPGDIYDTYINYENEGLSESGANYLGRTAPKGSLLMVCIGTIGKSNLIDRPCSYNQQINAITPIKLVPDYLLICVRSQYFQDMAWAKSSSTTISILNKGRWELLLIPLPPVEEQKRIVQKTTELLELVAELEKHLEE